MGTLREGAARGGGVGWAWPGGWAWGVGAAWAWPGGRGLAGAARGLARGLARGGAWQGSDTLLCADCWCHFVALLLLG